MLMPSVADARARARASLQKAQSGIHPVDQKRQAQKAAKLAEERAPAETFRAVALSYVERYAKKHTIVPDLGELQRQLNVDVFPNGAIGQLARYAVQT